MQVLKIKYQTDSSSQETILNYMKQYSSIQHFVYNRYADGYSQKQIKEQIKSLNNIDLMNSWFIQCTFYDCPTKKHIIFGGKKNYFDRLKGKISKEQFKSKRLSAIYSIGEIANRSAYANRFFHIEQDLENVIFKPNRETKIQLNLIGVGNRKSILKQLYIKQQNKEIKIAYKLDLNYIYIIFDEQELQIYKFQQINNRVLGIDMNPNYIGWSIVDWKSESEFKIIKSGIYSIKDLNDNDFNLKGKGFSSDSKERQYISNKRKYETIQIVKNLINKAVYYKCQIVSIEDLNMKSSDKEFGTKYNKLVNNSWNRNQFVNNLQKRCNIFNIKLLKVKPDYSSFIGNFLYRNLNKPDMVLASIELSRRGYEFYNQYITKTKQQKKNIVQPDIKLFNDFYIKSLEEFNIKGEQFKDLKELYFYFKKSKFRYRLSIDNFNLQFSRLISQKSNISKYIF